MYGFLLTIHVIVCILLIVVVLLQSGKDADLAGAFGGAGSQATFGPRGATTLLSKITTTLAILFMVLSLSLWLLAARKAESKSSVITSVVKVQVRDRQTRAPVSDAKVVLNYIKPGSLEDEQIIASGFTDTQGIASINLYDEGVERFTSVLITEAPDYQEFRKENIEYSTELEFMVEKKEEKETEKTEDTPPAGGSGGEEDGSGED